MTEPMRDRLLEACEPWDLPDGASIESSVVRNAHEIADAVLAVLADPDDATVEAIYRAISLAESLDDAPCAALAALVAHLTGEAS